MINSSTNTPIQAFPVKTTTIVVSGSTSGVEVKGPMIVHMNMDGNITCHYNTDSTAASITIPAPAGSDWGIDGDFDTIDVDADCVISRG